MQFDLRSFLENARVPYKVHFLADLSQADFGGYTLGRSGRVRFYGNAHR